jgi:uncharacterized SAM-binding protein YcdF (DUF218 family)
MLDDAHAIGADTTPRKRLQRPILTVRTRLLIVGIAAAVAAFGWLGGLIWFVSTLPADARVDMESHTDAIVVLTGGTNRLQTGIDLLREHKADKLFITGVYRGVEIAELLRLARNAPGDLECCIELDYEAGDTVGNAAETARWMNEHGYKSMRLVTSNYHMRRSMLEFRMAGAAETILAHPITPEDFHAEGWWRQQHNLSLLASEYTKYLITMLRYGLYRIA